MRLRNNKWGRENFAHRAEKNTPAISARRRRAPKKSILSAIKSRAKKAGLEFSLTIDDLIVPTHCPVLGIKLQKYSIGWGASTKLKDCSPSVDRIDNSRGYTPDNIVIVSLRANRLKSDATLDELKKLVRFYANLARRRAETIGESGVKSPDVRGQQMLPLPDMQRKTQEEVNSMPIG